MTTIENLKVEGKSEGKWIEIDGFANRRRLRLPRLSRSF